MRIGLVVPGFSADAGDPCIPALLDFVRTLAPSEDVRVIALRYPHRAGRYEVFGARVTALAGGDARGRRSARLWTQALRLIVSEHRRQPFDLLHAFWATESGALTALAGRWLGIPTLVSLAGGELIGLPDIGYGDQLVAGERLKVRLALRLATGVSAGSRLLLAHAAPWLEGRPAGSIFYAPLGIDTARFAPAPQRPAGDSPRLLHVASLLPVKDQATLLRAAGRLAARRRAFHLNLVGDGPARPALQALARELRLEEVVRFAGARPHAELPAIFRAADLFVLSSRHEAQCIALLEAAACGVPAVGTRVGILPEMEPAAALGVAQGDDESLAHAIDVLLQDEAMRTRMGVAAAARVAGDFELGTCVERMRDIYRRLVRRR